MKNDMGSVNGKLLKMANGEITLVADQKTLTIERRDVAIIEFNNTTSNSPAPGLTIGLGPPLKGSEFTVHPPEVPSTIVLWVGKRRAPCNLIGIDDQSVRDKQRGDNKEATRETLWVHCEGKDYSRSDVLRIVLGRTE